MTKQNNSKKNISLKRGINIPKIPKNPTSKLGSTPPVPRSTPSSTQGNPLFPNTTPQTPIKKSYKGFHGFLDYVHDHILFLNSSRFFAGVVMILLNIGSKFISVQFSKSTEEYLKFSITKQILVFAMAWMATRDIYTSLVLTAVFVVLSEFLFNEESTFCIVPHQYRVLNKLVDTNNDGIVSHEELNQAIQILEKAKKEKQMNSTNTGTNTSTNTNGSGGRNGVGVQPNIGDNVKNTITKYMNSN